MKKMMILALGVLLLAGFVGEAMAETKVEFSGTYRVRYRLLYNTTLSDTSDQMSNQSYWDHRINIDTRFILSDQLRFVMRLRGIENHNWGTGATNDAGTLAANGDGGGGFRVRRAFMEIGNTKTNWGRVRIGRMSGGVAGLGAMGYVGGMWATTTGENELDPFDSEGSRHRVHYLSPAWGGFRFTAIYEKRAENQKYNLGGQALFDWDGDGILDEPYPGWDDDSDAFYFLPAYSWGGPYAGAVNILFGYLRDRSNSSWSRLPNGLYPVPITTDTGFSATPYDLDLFVINPAFMMSIGPFVGHLEASWRFGEMRFDDMYAVPVGFNRDTNVEGWGVYLDGIYTYGPGEVGAWFMYTQGNDPNTNDLEGVQTVGGDFAPLLIAYDLGTDSVDVVGASNNWSVGAWGAHNVTEDLMLRLALGYIGLDQVPAGWDESWGFEVDLGASYQIMDGLRFTTQAGYLFPGDFHKFGNFRDVSGMFGWKNKLELSF